MNRGTIVRMDVDAFGADLRIWIDDEKGRHLTVAEVRLSPTQLATLGRELDQKVVDAAQLLLWPAEDR